VTSECSSLCAVIGCVAPISRGTFTPPGEAESGSAGTQLAKEYPGEGVPMVRQAPAATGCQGPLFCPPSAALFIPQKIRPCFLGNTSRCREHRLPSASEKFHHPGLAYRPSESGASLAVEGYPQRASIRVVCPVQAPITLCCMRPKAITRSIGPGTTHLVFGSTQGSPAASTVAQTQFLTYP
jgi:hypothetical protein